MIVINESNYCRKVMVLTSFLLLSVSLYAQQWECVVEKAPWAGRCLHGFVVFQGKMWLIKGKDDGDPIPDIWSSSNGSNWSLELDSVPSWPEGQSAGLGCTVYDGSIWITGGVRGC